MNEDERGECYRQKRTCVKSREAEIMGHLENGKSVSGENTKRLERQALSDSGQVE